MRSSSFSRSEEAICVDQALVNTFLLSVSPGGSITIDRFNALIEDIPVNLSTKISSLISSSPSIRADKLRLCRHDVPHQTNHVISQ